MASLFEATRKGRGAEMLEQRRSPGAESSSAARPIEMVLTNKLTYRKLFAPLNLDDKCNLICSTELKARWQRGAAGGAGSPAPCGRDFAATQGSGERRCWNGGGFLMPHVPVTPRLETNKWE